MSDARAQVVVLRFIGGTSDKFYAVLVSGSHVTMWWGRGEFYESGNPQQKREVFPDHAAAVAAANKIVESKNRSGYNRTAYAEYTLRPGTLVEDARRAARGADRLSGFQAHFTRDPATWAGEGLFAPENDPEWAAIINFGDD